MPEQPAPRAPWQARRMTWSVVCLLPFCGIAASAFAQSVPPGLRACMAETDSLRRLVCYDKEMARLTSGPSAPAATPPPPPPPAASAPPPAAASPPPPTVAAPPPPAATAPPAPAAASAPAATPHRSFLKSLVGGSDSRVTAHVSSLDRSPNAMVLHLDNGQAWQQIGRASGDLTLREGDSVTIEKHLGSYWLSSRYVSDMKVRLAPPSN